MPRKEYAGSFLFGRRRNNQPQALDEWCVVTADVEIGEKAHQIIGGRIEVFESGGSRRVEVSEGSASVQILLDGAESVQLEMFLWGDGRILHHCDGVFYLSPLGKLGQRCGCPIEFEARKANAKSGVGPQPSVDVSFRLSSCPELGIFSFRSNSWDFFQSVNSLKSRLTGEAGETLCRLFIEAVKLETEDGVSLAYYRPCVEVWEC